MATELEEAVALRRAQFALSIIALYADAPYMNEAVARERVRSLEHEFRMDLWEDLRQSLVREPRPVTEIWREHRRRSTFPMR